MTSEEYYEYDDDEEDLFLEFLNYIITLKEQNKPIEISIYEILKSNHELKKLIFNDKGELNDKWNVITFYMRKMRKEWLNRFSRIYKVSNEDRVEVFQHTIETLRNLEIYHFQYFREINTYKEPSYAEFKRKQIRKYISVGNELEKVVKDSIKGAMKLEEIGNTLLFEIKQEQPKLLSENFEEEQSNEKNLKEISFIKEKISRLEAEGINHNTKVLERLEDRLKMIMPKTDESEQIPKIELKVPRIFDKKTTEKIKKIDKKWGDLDTWIKGDQKTEEISKEESSKIPELKKDESTTFVNYELNSETKNVQTSEKLIEKWGEVAYEESKISKIESTTPELNNQSLEEEIIENHEDVLEKTKEEQSPVEITKEEQSPVEITKEEIPKKRIVKIVRRIIK